MGVLKSQVSTFVCCFKPLTLQEIIPFLLNYSLLLLYETSIGSGISHPPPPKVPSSRPNDFPSSITKGGPS